MISTSLSSYSRGWLVQWRASACRWDVSVELHYSQADLHGQFRCLLGFWDSSALLVHVGQLGWIPHRANRPVISVFKPISFCFALHSLVSSIIFIMIFRNGFAQNTIVNTIDDILDTPEIIIRFVRNKVVEVFLGKNNKFSYVLF